MGFEKITLYNFAFCNLTDKPTVKIYIYRIDERNVQRKNFLFKLGAGKIEFPYFYISTFCSLTDRPTDEIFIE